MDSIRESKELYQIVDAPPLLLARPDLAAQRILADGTDPPIQRLDLILARLDRERSQRVPLGEAAQFAEPGMGS
jgi:hypothetical protein